MGVDGWDVGIAHPSVGGMPAVAGLARGESPLPQRGQLRHAHRVPFFMDRHEFVGLSAEEAAVAHLKDLKIQGRYGVRFLTYWFDEERQTAFCLAKAPSADAVEEVHRASHGYMAYEIIEVDEPTVARFMGGILEHPPGRCTSKRRSARSCSPTLWSRPA
jgi:hypothetical protein